MSIISNLPRWIQLSALKHFTDNISNLHIFVEGQERRTNQQSDWCEIRIDGPHLRQLTRIDLKVNSEINILVSTVIDAKNVAREVTNIGKVLEAFITFNIYKYGSEEDDDSTLVGCFQMLPRDDLREKLEVAKFGQIDQNINLLQSTVEGHYEMILTV